MKVLNLIIKQKYFDAILAGRKVQEFREVRPTTIKKLLQLDEEGFEIEDADGNAQPIKYDAIQFYVGYNKDRDSASKSVELKRSQIKLHEQNPRTIPEENRKALKRGIKKFGMVGGIVVNKRTGYTLVSGHQRLSVMDELQKYNTETKDNDYPIRVDLIDVEEKEEKELLILLNNPSAQGEWNYDTLIRLTPPLFQAITSLPC